jgi:hypothetical protein
MIKSPPKRNASATFLVELIKPSHYDDDGYVIQWWRGFVPSNSLSALYGLAQSSRQRQVLGDGVEIQVAAYDETTTAIPIKRIIRRFKRNGNQGLVCSPVQLISPVTFAPKASKSWLVAFTSAAASRCFPRPRPNSKRLSR